MLQRCSKAQVGNKATALFNSSSKKGAPLKDDKLPTGINKNLFTLSVRFTGKFRFDPME